MDHPTTKAELLEQVRAMHATLKETIAPILPAQMCIPGVNGAWSVKDELAHLTFWEARALALLRAVLAGEEPPHPPLVGDAEKIDAMNAEVFAIPRHMRLDTDGNRWWDAGIAGYASPYPCNTAVSGAGSQ